MPRVVVLVLALGVAAASAAGYLALRPRDAYPLPYDAVRYDAADAERAFAGQGVELAVRSRRRWVTDLTDASEVVEVTVFGVLLATTATWIFGVAANILTAALALAGFYFYVFVYTHWLKRSSPQNIVIGGAAGAVPPLVGYAVATGHLGLAALVLFGLVFLWTPPHFWALALLLERDYAAARIPMLPVVRGTRETTRQIVLYSLALVAFSLLPLAWGQFGIAYTFAAALLGAWLLRLAIALRRDPTRRRAALLFHYSLLYLALLFVAVGLDPLLG